MNKKVIFSIIFVLLLVGWAVLVHSSHDEWFRNGLWGAGAWFFFRFLLRGFRKNSASKWWDVFLASTELILVAFLIGSINLTAVNMQSTPSNLWNFLKGAPTVQYDWTRVLIHVLEVITPAIIGFIIGGMCRKTKN